MRLCTAAFGGALLLLAPLARAETYSYVDEKGVIHFTNIPPTRAERLEPVERRENTFLWQDPVGATRQVHRLDVTRYDALIREAADYYRLPAALLKAVVAVESAFEPRAVSTAGAQGLMQLIPQTAREMVVSDPFDPRDNIFGGARYLRILANKFKGDLRLTLAAYNAGPEAVEKAGDVPPFTETRTYVLRAMAAYRHYLVHWQVER